MGNNDYTEGACNFENFHTNNCDTCASTSVASPDTFCQFLKCVPREKPIYLEMPGDENINVHRGIRSSNIVHEEHLESSQHPDAFQQSNHDSSVKNMTAEQDENYAWVIRWDSDKEQDDFIGLSFLGESFILPCIQG